MWKQILAGLRGGGLDEQAFDEAIVMLQASHSMHLDAVAALDPDGIVISPGPGDPTGAGATVALVASSTAADITGLLAAGLLFSLGLFILPHGAIELFAITVAGGAVFQPRMHRSHQDPVRQRGEPQVQGREQVRKAGIGHESTPL